MAGSIRKTAKRTVIRLGLEMLGLPGICGLFPAAAGRGIIFTLHHVRPAGTEPYQPNAGLSITPGFLEQAIEACREAGFVFAALEDLPRLLADPSDTRRFAVFTLDDGYRDNAQYAAPVFRRYQVPYTIFITAGFVERSRSMWWETAELLTRRAERLEFPFGETSEMLELDTPARKQAAFERFERFMATADEDEAVARLDALARSHGIDPLGMVADLTMDARELGKLAQDPLARFGAHTLTHPNLRRVDDTRLRRELRGSAEAVESYVGRYPFVFAYPYGFAAAVGPREIAAAAEAGFAAAVTTQPGMLSAKLLEHPTALPRMSLNGYFQRKRYVRAMLSGLPAKFA